MLYSEIVAVLIEVRGVMGLPVNRLGRAQRVRKCHGAEPGLSHESGVVVLLLGQAIDLQVDFADGFAPGLPALSGRECLGIENDPHSVLPMCRSERADGDLTIPVAIAGLADGRCGEMPRRRWESRQPADRRPPLKDRHPPLGAQRIFPAAKGKSARTPAVTDRTSSARICAAAQEPVRWCASERQIGLRKCDGGNDNGRGSAGALVFRNRTGAVMLGRIRGLAVSQEKIVFLAAIALFIVFSVFLRGFLTSGNLITLVRGVSTLGILGVGMAIVVIGRGVDLTIVAIYAMSAAWTLHLAGLGVSIPAAMVLGFLLALTVGAINGVLIAYVEIPALFATLGMAPLVYGFVRYALVPLYVVYMPPSANDIAWIGGGFIAGMPTPILFFALIALLGFAFLRFSKPGRFIYAIGDNFAAARNTGAPVRPIIVLQYALSASIAYVAGMITATAVASMNTNVANSSLIYDVILVVVLGGIGLSGGRGGIRNVIVGTLLIGILLNGMTIMNIQYTLQNVIRSVILLAAIVLDSIINPRDEQTAQQGDI